MIALGDHCVFLKLTHEGRATPHLALHSAAPTPAFAPTLIFYCTSVSGSASSLLLCRRAWSLTSLPAPPRVLSSNSTMLGHQVLVQQLRVPREPNAAVDIGPAEKSKAP